MKCRLDDWRYTGSLTFTLTLCACRAGGQGESLIQPSNAAAPVASAAEGGPMSDD